jgi:hypothetical protein
VILIRNYDVSKKTRGGNSMKATNVKTQTEVQNENVHAQETSKVGTWISVGIVGLVILATYFVLYGLYMARV